MRKEGEGLEFRGVSVHFEPDGINNKLEKDIPCWLNFAKYEKVKQGVLLMPLQYNALIVTKPSPTPH